MHKTIVVFQAFMMSHCMRRNTLQGLIIKS